MPAFLPSVSVIIPSYNSFKTIGFVISHLYDQTEYDRIREIIIVDSSDDNNTKKILSVIESTRTKVIHSGTRIIPAIQRNMGAREATGEVLIFLDSDTFPDENYIKNILQAYENGYMAGGGSINIPDFQLKHRLVKAQFYLYFNEFMRNGEKRTKKLMPSTNLFCDRELFFRVGGFPEIRASEDCLFTLKINEIVRLRFLPDAKVYHIFRESKKDYRNTQFLAGKYIYIYRKLYYDSFYLRGLFAFFFLPFIMTFKFLRIYLRIWKSGSRHFKEFNKSIPFVATGMNAWGKGFYYGIVDFKEIASELN